MAISKKLVIASVVAFGILATFLGGRVLLRHYKLYRFPKVPYNYAVRPNETIVCSRPFDEPGYQNFYPLFKHAYFKTTDGRFGYHYNEDGPSTITPDNPENTKAVKPENHECWVVSSDPVFKECVYRKIKEKVKKYQYPNQYVAVLGNACATLADDVVESCRKEVTNVAQ